MWAEVTLMLLFGSMEEQWRPEGLDVTHTETDL